MGLNFHYFDEVFQKDVNNYIMMDRKSGIAKTKGTYVKKLDNLDYDLPIVNKAMVDYFVNETSIEKTINEYNGLRQFQRVIKLSYKFDEASLGNRCISGKVQRVFASNKRSAPRLYKVKQSYLEKIRYTPEHIFIDNSNVINKKVPAELDRGWYIKLAKVRARDFGY